MEKEKMLKIGSVVCMVLGAAASLAGGYFDTKNSERTMQKEVAKAVEEATSKLTGNN